VFSQLEWGGGGGAAVLSCFGLFVNCFESLTDVADLAYSVPAVAVHPTLQLGDGRRPQGMLPSWKVLPLPPLLFFDFLIHTNTQPAPSTLSCFLFCFLF
jgi:hypothetical protein